MMKIYRGIFTTDLMLKFPSRTAAETFSNWVANHVGLEQILGLAGMLDPELYEVEGLVFWNRYVAERLEQWSLEPWEKPKTSFGSDPETVERYYNIVNLAEFFLFAADDAVEDEELVAAFGRVLQHFWSMALRARFPDRTYNFEIAEDMYDEEGLCLTFWQDRG